MQVWNKLIVMERTVFPPNKPISLQVVCNRCSTVLSTENLSFSTQLSKHFQPTGLIWWAVFYPATYPRNEGPCPVSRAFSALLPSLFDQMRFATHDLCEEQSIGVAALFFSCNKTWKSPDCSLAHSAGVNSITMIKYTLFLSVWVNSWAHFGLFFDRCAEYYTV